MNNTQQQQFQKTVRAMLLSELHKWERGEKKWKVSNQFNEEILKSAIQELKKPKTVRDAMVFFKHTEPTVMDMAHHLTTFNTPYVSDSWSN